jgi:type IV secretory pathway VirB2 component (pilin)
MKNFLQNKYWQSAVIFGSLLALPSAAFAQSGSGNFDTGLGNIGGLFPRTGIANSGTFQDLLMNVISILLLVAGGIAIVFVIIGGYQYMTSAGNEETAEKGKKNVINAIIGIVIILLSYEIITVIANLVSTPAG